MTLVVNITGPVGSGKTTKAKEIAELWGSAFFAGSGRGPFELQGYAGESVIVFDEVAPPRSLYGADKLVLQRKNRNPEIFPMPKAIIVTSKFSA